MHNCHQPVLPLQTKYRFWYPIAKFATTQTLPRIYPLILKFISSKSEVKTIVFFHSAASRLCPGSREHFVVREALIRFCGQKTIICQMIKWTNPRLTVIPYGDSYTVFIIYYLSMRIDVSSCHIHSKFCMKHWVTKNDVSLLEKSPKF